MPKIFTSKEKKAATNMLLEGVSPKTIAAHFGVHRTTIYELRKVEGIGHTDPHRASHRLDVRLTDIEMGSFNAFVNEAGFPSKPSAMRSLIRAAMGFLELKRSEYLDLSEVSSELKAQGRNLNQLTRLANVKALKGKGGFTDEDRAFLSEVARSYSMLNGKLSDALSEARQQGRSSLRSCERL